MNFNINFQDIKWSEFATTQFWFAIDRSMLHLSDRLFLLAAVVLLVLGLIVLAYGRFINNQFLSRVAYRVAKIFISVAVLEGLWYFLRTQYVQVFGTKFAAALVLLAGLVWLYWPIKYLITNYKVDMAEAQRAASREKYLKR